MKKKWMTALIVGIAAMFAWIFIAVALTGGREPADYTPRDKQIMVGFAVMELLTAAVLIVSACKLGIEVGRSMPKPEPVKWTDSQRAQRRIGAGLMWGSLLLAFAAQLLGIFLWKRDPAWVSPGAKTLCGLGYSLGLVVLPLCSVLANRLYGRRFSRMNSREANAFLLSHREQAEQTAQRKLSAMTKLHLASNVYALALFLLGLLLAFSGGYLYQSDTWSVPRLFGAALILGAAAQQLVLPVPKSLLREQDGLLEEQEYPQLYRMARQAAEETGWQGPVRLFVGPVTGAAVMRIRQVLCIRLGALTLGLMTQEELYAILLHEFAHEAGENRRTRREEDYFAFLSQGRNPNAVSFLTGLFYAYLDARYELEHELYHYAASIGMETRADRAMAGNPPAAASSLLKLKYFDLYLWEQPSRDGEPDWQPGLPPENLIAKEAERFLHTLPFRREEWERLTKAELPSRSATHPTTWSRIRSFGLEELPELAWKAAGSLAEEAARAVAQMDRQIAQGLSDSYEERRREEYLEPLERVQAWETEGCPLTAEGYGDVVEDLQALRRETEAVALCERAIRELPPAAAFQAYFTRGIHRLHCFDDSGLEDLYTAIEGNSNYLEAALDQIGSYCCLTGLRQELEEYREKALELAQRQKEEFSQLDTLTRRDNLSPEHLPQGMLEGILAFLQAHDQGSVDKVFLMRKTISERFFTSAVILRFLPDTPPETRAAVLHQIFRYLDTSTDWQFSLFDEKDLPKGLTDRVEGCCVFSR